MTCSLVPSRPEWCGWWLESLVESCCAGGVDTSRWPYLGDAVGVEFDGPAVGVRVVAGFDDGVVVGADEYQVVQGGVPVDPPGHDVVGLAQGWGYVAAGEHAAFVADHEGGPDFWGDEPAGGADVHRDGVAAHHDGEDVGVAGQSA